MGYYIDPPDMSKEDFLRQKGVQLSTAAVLAFDFNATTHLPVCLVDNGPFTAAGIAFCAEERDAFLHPDPRPKRWFAVSCENPNPYLPERLRV